MCYVLSVLIRIIARLGCAPEQPTSNIFFCSWTPWLPGSWQLKGKEGSLLESNSSLFIGHSTRKSNRITPHPVHMALPFRPGVLATSRGNPDAKNPRSLFAFWALKAPKLIAPTDQKCRFLQSLPIPIITSSMAHMDHGKRKTSEISINFACIRTPNELSKIQIF